MPRIASFLGIPGQERGFEQYTCLLQACLCSNPDFCFHCCPLLALRPYSLFIFQIHLLSLISFKNWKVSFSSRYYFLSCICSQPTYTSLEEEVYSSEPTGLLLWFCVVQKAAKTWALGSLGSLGSSGFLPTSRVTALCLGAYFSHAEPQACCC